MIALVTYPYRDRETLAVHLVGEEVELTEARFAELSALGHVDPPRPPSPRLARSPSRTRRTRARTSWTTNPSSPCTRSLHPR